MTMDDQPKIADRCPSCGGSLFIGTGGWITCSNLGCKEPGLTRAIEALKKKPPSSLDLIRVSHLFYPIMLAQEQGQISEAKAAELLGFDIVSLRETKAAAVQSIMAMVESLPSPLTLLLGAMKGQQGSSTKKSDS